jgi:hypothetical protein
MAQIWEGSLNIKAKIAALKKQAVPVKHKPVHRVLIQTKVVHASNTVVPENPKHRRIETTRFPVCDIDDSPELKQAARPTAETFFREELPTLDATLENAIKLVTERGIAYTTLFMERMAISYTEAAHMLDALEKAGVVAPAEKLELHTHSYRRVWGLTPEKEGKGE